VSGSATPGCIRLKPRIKKTALAVEVRSEVAEELVALLGRQSVEELDLEALEMVARRTVLAWAARLIQNWLNADESDRRRSVVLCGCGRAARYVERRSKRVQSALGELELQRAYYHCSHCGRGFCPRDQQLGIEGSLSPAVIRMIAAVGAMVSFQEGSQLLDELAGIAVDAKQVERLAESLGADVATDEKQDLSPWSQESLPSTLYLGIDGTGVPMRRSELTGRSGKQPDGSAKTREVKLCTCWSAESRDPAHRPVRDAGSISYTAAIESAATLDTDEVPAAFAQRVLREATRRRFTAAERTVVLGDGAPWIWKIAQELFPRAIQIVDRFHVKQHLSDVAKAIYGANSKQARVWAQRRHEELDSGRIPDLLRALCRHADRSEEARKCLQYIHRNRDRMKYPAFEAQGLCTSTGVVEAGCKVAIGTRLKRAGMHWTTAGANSIIALRCSRLSGRFQDFWERRSERNAA
jgi:hypothetical protein